MDEERSVWHTCGAVPTILIAYVLVFHYGTPVIEWVLNLYGTWIVPERFGGGSKLDDRGALANLMQILLISGISTLAAVYATSNLFRRSHPRVVLSFCAGTFVCWAGFLLFLMPPRLSIASVMVMLMITAVAIPPLFFAFFIWRDNDW